MHAWILVFGFLATAVVALESRAVSACSNYGDNIRLVKKHVRHSMYFCQYYLGVQQTHSPLPAQNATVLATACQCILKEAHIKLPSGQHQAPKLPALSSVACNAKYVKTLTAEFTYPKAFCSYMATLGRSYTPIQGLTATGVLQGCKCILPSSSTTTRKSTSATTRKITSKSVLTSARSTTTSPRRTPASTMGTSISSVAHATTTFRRSSTPLPSTSFPLSHSPTSRTSRATSGTPISSSATSSSVASLVPATNAAVDRSNLANLKPSKLLRLFYAEEAQVRQKRTTSTIAIIDFDMLYDAIDLENSTYISAVVCSAAKGTLSFAATGDAAINAINNWPQELVLITNTCACNNATDRGVYVSQGWTSNDRLYHFNVVRSNMTAVAETMKITYGVLPDTTVDVPVCPTASSSSAFTMPTSFDDLSPGAQAILAAVVSNFNYAGPGVVDMSIPATSSTITVPTLSPTAKLSPADDAALQFAGLDPPSHFADDAASAFADTCGAKGTGNLDAPTSSTKNSTTSLSKRNFDWDLAGEIGSGLCKAAVVIGSKGEEDGDECDGIEDGAKLVGCLANACYKFTTSTTYITTTVITGYRYDFDDNWSADTFYPDNSVVLQFGDGSTLSCVHCALNMSKIVVLGEITTVIATGEVTAATILVSEATTAQMIMELKTKQALQYQWDASVSTLHLDAVNVANLFTITPTVVVAFGAYFKTNSAVNATAGAALTWNNASVDVNVNTYQVSNPNGWQPSIAITYPAFATDSSLTFSPYIRRTYNITFLYLGNQLSSTLSFGSQTAINFQGDFLDAPAGTCKANQLRLQAKAGNKQTLTFPGVGTLLLNEQIGKEPDLCLNIPAQTPSRNDISALSQIGQDFCTSYIEYIPSTIGVYTTAQVTVPTTSFITDMITVVSTPTSTATTTTTLLITQTHVTQVFSTGTASGLQSLASQYLKREQFDYGAFRPTASAGLRRRSVPTPALVSNWPATEIAYACSLLATGTVTSTFTTSTATVTSGTVNVTRTSYVPAVGTPYTTTSVSTRYEWETVTSASSTVTLASACPLQTQESCFTLIGHGRPGIEGRSLGVYADIDVPSFNIPATTFYIDCDGALVSLPDQRVLSSSTTSDFLSFLNRADATSAASCTKDVVQKTVSCSLGSSNLMWIPEFNDYWNILYSEVTPRNDPRLFMPMWTPSSANVSANNTITSYPIRFTYAEATCPCGTPAAASVDVYKSSAPNCPSGDGTTYQTPDGEWWQVQCFTDYCCSSIAQVAAKTLAECIGYCAMYGLCYGVTYVPPNAPARSDIGCVLKPSIGSPQRAGWDDDPSSVVISAIRLTVEKLPHAGAGGG
ncbi:hypothetical protein K461DRAFT_113769 [Myriangium duriaei CBS 260.36]|uniref:DUF7029 domain-containing protein n=1 Tax=Myriangium duriaei CBS 260.36 TaxID=1168546 RepID=A0A9P4MJQ6_9PEZI|nr:hypothetical protein K461DRAFT_113769 [Myriangium duriaei CBS 260.36]